MNRLLLNRPVLRGCNSAHSAPFLIALLLTASFYVQAAPASRRPTGWLPPTEQDLQWMEKNMTVVRDVNLNSLAVARINAHRRSQGLTAIDPPVVVFGDEVVSSQAVKKSTLPGGLTAGNLPPVVDNSKLPSFPPIRNQGSHSSCVSFSTTYYVATHMLGRARGWNNKNEDNTLKLSPKWTYPIVNDGQDSGSYFSTTIDVLLKHGAASWADFPYSDTTTFKNYLEWSRDAGVWRKAISYRFEKTGYVQNLDTAAGLNDLKALLANGYALLYSTDIDGWDYLTIQDDPSTAADSEWIGRRACAVARAVESGHAMTVVGYNDHIWIDLNKNGQVDAGEKGALRIANSWGDDWVPGEVGSSDGGFTWVAYDALKLTSAVPGAGTVTAASGSPAARQPVFYGNYAIYLTARAAYTPKLLAQFTVSHKSRSQLEVRLGRSTTTETTPRETWKPAAIQKQGGNFGFDGTANELSGTFVMDLSDLPTSGANRYYLVVTDGTVAGAATISDFRLTDAAGNTLAVSQQGIPGTANSSTATSYLDYGLASLAITSKALADGTVGQPFAFTVTASATPATFGAVGLPRGLTINSTTGVIAGTPAETGTFTVSLSVSNPNGSGSGVLILKLDHPPTEPPTITSNTQSSGTAGASFTYAITATGSPTSYGAANLPSGLSLNETTGVISGIPTAIGTFTVQLSAANAGGPRTRALTITINPPAATVPVITSATTASVGAGSPFNYRITANNNPTSFGAEGLPSGLALNATDGVITGIPSLARQYVIQLSARNTAGTGYATLILAVTGDSSFGPPNDSFANRSTLVGAATVTGGNSKATAEPGEPTHAGIGATSSVWWTWIAPANGSATLSTSGSDFDTLLAVYTGSNFNALKAVASDDDSGSNLASLVTFPMQAGTTYQIAVDTADGSVGNIKLGVQFQAAVTAVANDNFENPTILSGANVSENGRNYGATAQAGEPNHAGAQASRSVWWSWTAPGSGKATVKTAGSDFDTVLAIYTASNPPLLAGLTRIASNDEGGPNGTSLATFSAITGTRYFIAVDGFKGKEGNIKLDLQLEPGSGAPNDNFTDAIVLSGANVTTTGSNVKATYETGEPDSNIGEAYYSVWWKWTAPASGPVTIDTAGSNFDTTLAIFTGPNLRQLTEIKSNDDDGSLPTSRVRFSAISGTTYNIAVDGWNTGAISLHLQLETSAPANDNFAGSAPLLGSTPRTSGNNLNAGGQTGEPKGEEAPADKSVWWKWTASASGRMMFTTAGSDFDTVIAIYTGPTLTNLTYVASNDDDGEQFTSRVTFWAASGNTYHIAVDGYDGASGNIELSSEFVPPGDKLFETDFDTFPLGEDELVGADGWQGFNTNDQVQGIYEAFEEMGGSAYLGYGDPDDSYTGVYQTLNFDPVAQNRPIVGVSVDFSITDSTNDEFDTFGFSLYNRAGDFLASLIFDNSDLSIWYQNGTNSLRDTGWTFENDELYTLDLRLDFATNRWTASIGGVELFRNVPINVDGRTRNVGDFAVEWELTDSNAPGDNYITFDNLLITAGGSPKPPTITIQPQGRTVPVGGAVTLNTAVTGTPPLLYQWRLNGQALPGETNATLILLDLQTNRVGTYTMTVSNQIGSVTSAPALINLAANVVPLVTLARPTQGAVFTAPALIQFVATASDNDGTVSKVEFYQGATKLGEDTESPYAFAWTNVSAGTYQVRARVIDNAGAAADSSPVTVVVNPPTASSGIRFGPLTLAGGVLQIGFTGSPGNYIVQRSSDLITWSDLKTVTITSSGSTVVQDTVGSASNGRAFYRVKRP